MAELRALVIVLGDQLDLQSSAFDGFDAAQDAVRMAEVAEESTHVWSGKPRIALFLAAMRPCGISRKRSERPAGRFTTRAWTATFTPRHSRTICSARSSGCDRSGW